MRNFKAYPELRIKTKIPSNQTKILLTRLNNQYLTRLNNQYFFYRKHGRKGFQVPRETK